MDTLGFIAAMTTAVAWPTAVVILGLSQKEPISRLVDRIKSAKFFGADLGMSEKLEAIRETIGDEAPTLPLPDPAHNQLQAPAEPQDEQLRYAADEMSRSSATGTIILAWIRLEQGIRKIAEQNQLGSPGTTLSRTLRTLQEVGIISRSHAQAISQLRDLRNQVVHTPETAVTLLEALEFRDTVDELLRAFGLNAGLHASR